jgi:hypothetical protein
MPKAVMVVMTNVSDASKDADFNQWYDDVHLSDVLMTPGINKATRFKLAQGKVKEGRGQYLALYELEVDDLSSVMAKLNETLDRRKAEGSVILHPNLEVAGFALYEQIGEPQVEK